MASEHAGVPLAYVTAPELLKSDSKKSVEAANAAASQQASPRQQDAAPAARIIQAHVTRPAVDRSILQHIAKAFGIHLKGAVATNEVSTAKYTLLTFLPVNLFEQFLRVANLYFLLTAILQLIPGLSPTSWFTTVAPLVFVLAVNAIKEGYDDVHRHKNDNQINNREVLRLDLARSHTDEKGQVKTFWKDVVAGDLIKVRADEEIPADLLLLSSPDDDHLCYVETANLDGETNLKIKYAWSRYNMATTVEDFKEFANECAVGFEAPNPRLYSSDGYVQTPDGKSPIDINNLLLRGSILRKTPWAIGMALNVGSDSKIVQNMTQAPRKVTQLERVMNTLVMVQFSILLIFCAVLAGLDQWWLRQHPESRVWYLKSVNAYPELPPGGAAWVIMFLRFLILLSNMIPISLYVSLEVVKVFQCALLLNSDRQMYHKDSDTPFVCRTTTLNEELGQVEYVLSDKTGTLTQNVMGFVWASIAGRLYKRADRSMRASKVPPDTPHSIALCPELRNALQPGNAADLERRPEHVFFLNLAICNTVVPGEDPNVPGKLLYQASSPDEEALVQGAAYLGYELLARTTDFVRVRVHGAVHTYDILATLEFNSDRKRMSIIVRGPDGKITLMCKGADTMILSRLKDKDSEEVQIVQQHLNEMSGAGLRTLLISQKDLTADQYTQWQDKYAESQVAMENREDCMAAEQEKIETDLRLVGGTAVEDKLQDGVPDCLEALGNAGIKVWVLTGDKVETAISIAWSCRLFADGMGIITFREEDFLRVKAKTVDDRLRVIASIRRKVVEVIDNKMPVGIVMEGGALTIALEQELQDALMELCKLCRAVVCCRVSPMQKAQITHMVKKRAGAITLGIGDGANDVGMIRAAHIGVGISGREGRAAVLAADFSFAQFGYLQRLLLLHGRWSFLRNREVVLYSFYKNWAYVLVYVYLQFLAGFSSVPIFTTLIISTFNLIFTACPIVAYAVIEQDLHKDTILANPATYASSRTATKRNTLWLFVMYMIAGAWHSLPVFFLCWFTLTTPGPDGLAQDLSGVGTAVFISLVITVTLKLCLRTHSWSWITHLVYWLSVVLLFPFVYVISILWPSTSISGVADMTGTGAWLFSSATFWLAALAGAPAIALLPDIAIMLFRRYIRPDIVTLLQEQELLQKVKRQLHSRTHGGIGDIEHSHNSTASMRSSQKAGKHRDVIGTVFDAAAASASSPYEDAHDHVTQHQAGRLSRNARGKQVELADKGR